MPEKSNRTNPKKSGQTGGHLDTGNSVRAEFWVLLQINLDLC